MGDARAPGHEHADRCVRARRRARVRGDDHAGALSVAAVALYTGEGCHLCDRARETLIALRDELGFELVEIDITGDAELEERYREWIPVVEIDGRRAFVYFVVPDAFRARLAQSRPPGGGL